MAGFVAPEIAPNTSVLEPLLEAIENRETELINRLVNELEVGVFNGALDIFIKLVDIDSTDALVAIVKKTGFDFGKFYREFFERGKNESNGEKRWKYLNELVFVSDAFLRGFPPKDEITYEIIESWIILDVVRLVRVIVPLLEEDVLKEYFAGSEDSGYTGLIFTAAEIFDKNQNRIFGDLMDVLPEEVTKVALTTPKTSRTDSINNKDQFIGMLAVEKLFTYTDAEHIVYESLKFSQLPRIMRWVRAYMFHLLDYNSNDLDDDEKVILEATINTAGRLIERLRYLGANSEIERDQDIIYEVYAPLTQLFHFKKSKIIELFARNQTMEWLFETTWDMKWISCGTNRYINIYDFRDEFPGKDLYMRTCGYTYIEINGSGEWRKDLRDDDTDDDNHYISMRGDRENQFYWRARGFVFTEGQGWGPAPIPGLAESTDEETDSVASSEDSDEFEPDQDIFGDYRNEEYWEERGYSWDEGQERWVEQEEFEVDRYSNEVNGNINYWRDAGFEWSDIHRQWIPQDPRDFLLFYIHSRNKYTVVGKDDIVMGPGAEEYRVTSVTRDAIKIKPLGGDEFNALLDDISFRRVSINYFECKKEIEPFDIVSVNGESYFVVGVMRQQDQTYRVKLRNLDGSWPDIEHPSDLEITYVGNGKNYLWMSKSFQKEIHEFRYNYNGMAADKDGIVVAIDSGPLQTEIELYDKFDGEKFPTIMNLDDECTTIVMEGDLIAVACGEDLYTFTRMGENLQKKNIGTHITCLAISPDKLFVGDQSGAISTILREEINKTSDGSYEYTIPEGYAHTKAVAVMDVDGDRLISSSGEYGRSMGSRLKIWDTGKAIAQDSQAGTPLRTIDDHAEFIKDVSIKGKYIVTGGEDKIVKKYTRDGTFIENIAVQFRQNLVVTDKYIVYDSLHNEGEDENPVYVLDFETHEEVTMTNAWAPLLSMTVVNDKIVMAWPEYSELTVYNIGGTYATAKFTDGEMDVYQNGEYLPWTGDDNITDFLKRYDTVQLKNNAGKEIYAIGAEWQQKNLFKVNGEWQEGKQEDVIILGFDKNYVELMVNKRGAEYSEEFRIPFTEMEDRYNRYQVYSIPQANAPNKDEIWVHRASGRDVTVTWLSQGQVFFEFNGSRDSTTIELDKFRYLFQIKPVAADPDKPYVLGSEWFRVGDRRRMVLVDGVTLAGQMLVPTTKDDLYFWFWEYVVAPPVPPLEDRDGREIKNGDMVTLIGYNLPWKVIEAKKGEKLRVKKLKPPKDPPEEDETLLVDASDTKRYYRPNKADNIILNQQYDVDHFRYDDLPNKENSLCMDIGTPQDCDIGEFTSTKYQPVAIMIGEGLQDDEVDGDDRLTIFCAKELKEWLLTPEVATFLDMGGEERQNFNPNTMEVLESDDLKKTSPFTNNQILRVRYLTETQIDEQVSKISEKEEKDNSEEIRVLEERIERLQKQVDGASGRMKGFFQTQLANARRSLMALQPTGATRSAPRTGLLPRMLKF